MRFTTSELHGVTILDGLPEWQLAWFADHGEKIDLPAGSRMFERGQPADYMFIVVRGVIQRNEEIAGQWLAVATTRQGEVTGMLPYSRMTHYPGHTVALEPSQVLRVKASDFPEMLMVSQEIGRRLVAVMADRVRGDVRLEQQRERMVALGRLSAGLAHELNNPAAAARRAAVSLCEQLADSAPLVLDLLRHRVDDDCVDAIARLHRTGRESRAAELPPLERSEREERITGWLEDHGVTNAWESGGRFADSGVSVEELERLVAHLPPATVGIVTDWVGRVLEAERMSAEIAASAARISNLIASVKSYSQMDRSPEQKPTDVREGLDSTLTMLSHALGEKHVRLVRDYPPELPVVAANPGELNQVWTNLIDNAVGALSDGGELRIQVRCEDPWVTVRVIDSGHGIPDAIRAHIFEPFFTTKSVGEGTGLGLDIALRIVRTHRGQIDVQSRPGHTEMCVRLPVTAR